jgi:selenocysteine-specific elongation factor
VHVVATAGHVDHGKSTLVKALTGTDPDRWAEERERGLTIDIGFADVVLPSGRGVAFVDVPGHVRFLKNMLAGVGGVDACLFVVSAMEGWKPQSEEHLRILELVGLEHGVVALTNVDLADDETVALAIEDVKEHLAGTFLEEADVVEVAAPAGIGISDLVDALDRMLATTPTAADVGRPRLWIDRSFAAKGAGTVVTGTLTGGSVHVGDELVLLPEGRDVRVRAIQSLHRSCDEIGPGNRVALNLLGVEHREVERGDVLVRAGQWHRTAAVDAELHVLASVEHPVSRRGAFKAYVGSGEYPAQVRILGPDTIGPGESGFLRLRLPVELPLVPGDRFVLRESGRGETVGGGTVLDVDPVVRASHARPDRSVERVVRERGWVDADALTLLTGGPTAPTVGHWVVDPPVLAEARERLRSAVAAAGPLGLDVATLDERDRAVLDLLAAEGVELEAGRARLRGQEDALADHPYLSALADAPFSPPGPEGVDRAELSQMVRRGLVVEEGGVYFVPSALDAAAVEVARLLAVKPDGITVAEIRDALGTSRKYVLPILAWLDGHGVTRRRGELRIAGPRLPAID